MFSTAQPYIQTNTQQMNVRTLNIWTTGTDHMQPANSDRSEKHGHLPTSAVQLKNVHKFLDNF
jgi:hypothetical protein